MRKSSRSSSKVILTKEVPMEETTFCDSMWACMLNDYGDDEQSAVTEQTDRGNRRRREAIERKERRSSREDRRSSSRERRSSSRSVSKAPSRSSRSKSRDRRHRRRGSSAHSKQSRRDSLSRRESLLEDDDDSDYGRDEREAPREEPAIKKVEEIQIPHAPSSGEREVTHANKSNRQANNEPAEEPTSTEKKQTKMERKRPEKLTTINGDDSLRETAPGKRDEAPPVLFRPIKNRYNPRSPTANSPRSSSPRVMSPVSSPRSPSHLRVDSAEFNTIEDYQKKVLEARDKRSGRKFERIQAIRAKSLNRVDP